MIVNWLAHVIAYSLQLSALVGTAVLVMRVLPFVDARWRFRLYQALFVAAVLLPALQPGVRKDATDSPSTLAFMIGAVGSPATGTLVPWMEIAALVLAAGIAVRVGHLLLGCFAIRGFVRRSTPLGHGLDKHAFTAMPVADIRVSNDVRSPATVGLLRTVILLPPRFSSLSTAAQQAVLLHELLHVRRRDWPRMLAEELWCAVLWFHPLARVLVSRLDLAREMLVDRCVLDVTGNRRAYAEALLAFASDTSSSARAALPLIRRAHLSERVAAVVQEVPMSRRSTMFAVGIMCLAVLPSTATAVRLIPMDASTAPPLGALRSTAAQDGEVFKAEDGVTLPKPTYEQKPEYTRAAMDAGIEGTALLAIVVQTDGTVGRVRVTKSLDTMYGLDEQAIAAARQWRFEPGRKDGKPVAVEVSLEFRFTLK